MERLCVQSRGRLEGRVLVFGGPCSNLAATQAMRAEAERRGLPPQQCICTGDIIAYCAEPCETLELIRDWGVPVVMGNCEEALAEAAPDCGCGFEEGSTCSALSDDWYRFSSRRVSEEQRQWMGQLPRAIRFELAGKQVQVVHGSTRRINEFIFASTDAALKKALLEAVQADLMIGGHCGLPHGQLLEPGAWLNSGVIGMPSNDGCRGGWYLLLEPMGTTIRASWHRLAYDFEATARRMRECGLDNGYARALETGLWPGTDILPAAEKARTGQPLSLPALIIG